MIRKKPVSQAEAEAAATKRREDSDRAFADEAARLRAPALLRPRIDEGPLPSWWRRFWSHLWG
jgi:hypothetical protein